MNKIQSWSDLKLIDYFKLENNKSPKKLFQIIYGIDIDSLTIDEFLKLNNDLSWINTPPKPKIPNFKLDGYNILLDPTRMKVSQYLDYCNTDKSDILGILSICITPKHKDYGDYDFEQHKIKISKLLSVQDCIDLNYFFQETLVNYSRYIQIYSMKLLRLKMIPRLIWMKIQIKMKKVIKIIKSIVN